MRTSTALLVGTLLGCGPQAATEPGSQEGGSTGPPRGDLAAPKTPPQPSSDPVADLPAGSVGLRRAALADRRPAVSANFASLFIPSSGGAERLSFKSLRVQVDVDGRMARTQVTQIFHNHTGRRTEGTYEMTLPEGASISRLAMDVEGRMMEGELVERDRARKIYESIVRKRKDPALLEWQGGNRFKTQVFPIEARSDKTVILAYEQLLPTSGGELRYTYGLPSLQGDAGKPLGRFEFTLDATGVQPRVAAPYAASITATPGGAKLSLSQAPFRPAGPLVVGLTRQRAKGGEVRYAGRKGERFFLVDYLAEAAGSGDGAGRDLVLALDTSAGIGAAELERGRTLALELIRRLPPERRVVVIHGDHRVQACHPQAVRASDGERLAQCLAALNPGGATDLHGLLREAAKAAVRLGAPASIVAITDGVASLGELDGDLITASVLDTLKDRPIALHTVAVGHGPNEDYLATLARRGRGHTLRMRPDADPVATAVRLSDRIRTTLVTGVEVTVESGQVQGLVPASRVNLAPGDSLAIMGKLISPSATLRLRGWAGDKGITRRFEVSAPPKAGEALLVNFWARGHIEALQRGHVDRARVTATSLKYGVMSRYTSFLVLENDEAYKRFGVDRRKEAERRSQQATAQNLTKGKGSLQDALKDAEARPAKAESAARAAASGKRALSKKVDRNALLKFMEEPGRGSRAVADAFARMAPEASVGQDRSRRSGGGESASIGDLRTHSSKTHSSKRKERRVRAKVSTPGPGRLTGPGQMDRAAVAATVRRRMRAIQSCFEREMKKNPQLHGGVTIRFTIGSVGRVTSARVVNNTTGAEAVGSCIRQRISRWRFPKPAGGAVTVEQTFSSGGVDPGPRIEFLEAQPELQPAERAELFDLYHQVGKAKRAKDRWRKWAKGRSAQDRHEVLSRLGPGTLADERLAVIVELLDQAPNDPLLGAFVRLGLDAGRTKEVADRVVRRCAEAEADLDLCQEWLAGVADDPRAKQLTAALVGRRIGQLQRRRSQDIANIDLIVALAKLLEQDGRGDQAQRILSEIVEFSPHDFAARTRYARELVGRGKVEQGCGQYASAVQLNPAERNTFRTMMSLRRQHGQHAVAIRRCIVDGVSKLPVQRAVSLVLTWEDDSADIDLHIHEQGGTEVFYSRRESEIGGLLYYDITDGYGPEIYVLGSGPKGAYRLSLVYYGGDAAEVSGTLTVLRDAGSPQERREDRPFLLRHGSQGDAFDVGV